MGVVVDGGGGGGDDDEGGALPSWSRGGGVEGVERRLALVTDLLGRWQVRWRVDECKPQLEAIAQGTVRPLTRRTRPIEFNHCTGTVLSDEQAAGRREAELERRGGGQAFSLSFPSTHCH
eukprot:2840662-Rhodomonas_salina.2